MGNFVINQIDLLRAHKMHQHMNKFPELSDQFREIFLSTMEDKCIVTSERIIKETKDLFEKFGGQMSVDDFDDYVNTMVDIYFVNHFTDADINNFINLVRKRAKCTELSRLLNLESTTSEQIEEVLRSFCSIPLGELYISKTEAMGIRVELIKRYISAQLPYISIAKNYITIRDINELISKSIGSKNMTGKLGGKAAGIVLMQKILNPLLEKKEPDYEKYVRFPETFFIRSDVFQRFLEVNNLHDIHTHKYHDIQEIGKEYPKLKKHFREAIFPEEAIGQITQMLEKIGEEPIIVRSSSYLEDNFDLAFAGKYESILLANQGDIKTRLEKFLDAAKQVYVSIYNPDPISYRTQHDVLDYNENMSLIVQKLIGRRFGDYFFPIASGVGLSMNSYRWTPKIKREDGLLRIVTGFGTRAVDRVGTDFPRMVSLSNPMLRPEITAEEIRQYSQKWIDVLNLRTGEAESLNIIDFLNNVDHPEANLVLSIEKDGYISAPMFAIEKVNTSSAIVTFENLLKKGNFIKIMKKILKELERVYNQPIDIDFAFDDNYIYVLQCRPLAWGKIPAKVEIPDNIPKKSILFISNHGLMNTMVTDIEYVVYVDPQKYAELNTPAEKTEVARAIGKINRALQDKKFILMGPGRWGSNNIDLGVKITFNEISNTKMLVEIAFPKKEYLPDVSYGTHFFMDLIETGIALLVIFPGVKGDMLDEAFFTGSNDLDAICPDIANLKETIKVLNIPKLTENKRLHIYYDESIPSGLGFIAPQELHKRKLYYT